MLTLYFFLSEEHSNDPFRALLFVIKLDKIENIPHVIDKFQRNLPNNQSKLNIKALH